MCSSVQNIDLRKIGINATIIIVLITTEITNYKFSYAIFRLVCNVAWAPNVHSFISVKLLIYHLIVKFIIN